MATGAELSPWSRSERLLFRPRAEFGHREQGANQDLRTVDKRQSFRDWAPIFFYSYLRPLCLDSSWGEEIF